MQQEAAALSTASGYGGSTRLPSAEGEHPQWQFARMGAFAFLIETHTQFQPSYTSAVTEATLVWPGILSVLERPIPISGHVTDASTGAPLAAKIELLTSRSRTAKPTASGGAYGGYHMFLPPGTYDVRFSATGYVPSVNQLDRHANLGDRNGRRTHAHLHRTHAAAKPADLGWGQAVNRFTA